MVWWNREINDCWIIDSSEFHARSSVAYTRNMPGGAHRLHSGTNNRTTCYKSLRLLNKCCLAYSIWETRAIRGIELRNYRCCQPDARWSNKKRLYMVSRPLKFE